MTSGLLAEQGIVLPTTQSFLNYALLALTCGPIHLIQHACRRRRHKQQELEEGQELEEERQPCLAPSALCSQKQQQQQQEQEEEERQLYLASCALQGDAAWFKGQMQQQQEEAEARQPCLAPGAWFNGQQHQQEGEEELSCLAPGALQGGTAWVTGGLQAGPHARAVLHAQQQQQQPGCTSTEQQPDLHPSTLSSSSPRPPPPLLHAPWYAYVLLAVLDVEANFLVLSAYQYTNVTSVTLLDCFTLPAVMMLSALCFKARYRCVCVCGGAVKW